MSLVSKYDGLLSASKVSIHPGLINTTKYAILTTTKRRLCNRETVVGYPTSQSFIYLQTEDAQDSWLKWSHLHQILNMYSIYNFSPLLCNTLRKLCIQPKMAPYDFSILYTLATIFIMCENSDYFLDHPLGQNDKMWPNKNATT